MSIYGDYSHTILHHQSERDLIVAAEHRRLAAEASGAGYATPWWRRLLHSDQRSSVRGLPARTVRPAH
ncbi:hypothetical protein [Microlunatus ginsengisoli]|uniref:Uncharacterized protein n=1 Tax=Microlunatus ginsengisoli TaxID=363863 RepID=A0ABP7A051_9ACTN